MAVTETTVNEITAVGNNTLVESAESTLSRLYFATRKAIMEAAMVVNPAAPFQAIVTQRATVVATAVARVSKGVK